MSDLAKMLMEQVLEKMLSEADGRWPARITFHRNRKHVADYYKDQLKDSDTVNIFSGGDTQNRDHIIKKIPDVPEASVHHIIDKKTGEKTKLTATYDGHRNKYHFSPLK